MGFADYETYMESTDYMKTSAKPTVAHIYGLEGGVSWCGKKPHSDVMIFMSGLRLCKTCHNRIIAHFDAKPAENTDTGESEVMAAKNDVNSEDGKKVIEQIGANTERAIALAEAENAEGLEELSNETEALISSLSGRGSAASRKKYREAFKAALQGVEEKKKEVEKVHTGVVTKETLDYRSVEGAEELVNKGAEAFAEGVRLNVKLSSLGKQLAETQLELYLSMSNKDGKPDVMALSQASKTGSRDVVVKAGELVRASGDLDDFEAEEAIRKLETSARNWRSDVRAEWAKSLDSDPEKAAPFAEIIAAASEGAEGEIPASAAVADAYGFSLKGHRELQREKYAKKQAIEAKKEAGEELTEEEAEVIGEAEKTPDEKVADAVKKLTRDVKIATPEDFESASDATREAVREKLEETKKALNALIAASL